MRGGGMRGGGGYNNPPRFQYDFTRSIHRSFLWARFISCALSSYFCPIGFNSRVTCAALISHRLRLIELSRCY